MATYDGNHYVYFGGDIEITHSRIIDIMPDSILHEWIVKDFIIKNWISLDELKTSEGLVKSVIELVNSTKLHKPVLLSRKKRAASTIGLLQFSYLEILDFAKNPVFKDMINQSIEINCEMFIQKEKGVLSDKLIKIKQAFQLQKDKEQQAADEKIKQIKENIDLEQLNYDIENDELLKKKKLAEESVKLQLKKIDELKGEIIDQEVKLQKITNAKDHLLSDFDVIREVMSPLLNNKCNDGANNSASLTEKNNRTNLTFLNDESESIKFPQTFQKRLEFYLTQNNRNLSISKKILGYLGHYKTILLPDNRIMQSILKATGQCYYSIQYVTPEWRSFDSVWNNGLKEIIDSCIKNPETLHYYILQNINMSYLPCFIQPIVDMTIGLIDFFPGSDRIFPENLRILMTSTEEEGLPLAIQNLKYFGCLQKDDYTINPKNENIFSSKKCEKQGYINLHFLKELSFTPVIDSEYLSYLPKDE